MRGTGTNGARGNATRGIGNRMFVGLLVVALAACGDGSGQDFLSPVGGGGGGTDTTAPTVVSTSPANGATSVPRTAPISVTFSENLDSATVTNAAFSFNNGVTGTIVVSGAVATLTPTPSLPASTTITGTLSTAIKDRAGNPLAAAVTFQFTTAP
ncbi:MAG TPA: Ig-like domain-containing protein [Gemmatimonadaceae bacterium]|nr:Ig-like domain-containing protein [Gemmatimonadaceae bacterium]